AELRLADDFSQPPPLTVITGRQEDRPVRRRDQVVWRDHRRAIAHGFTDDTGIQIAAVVWVQDGQDRLEQRCLDLLAEPGRMPRVKRKQNGLAGEQAGREVGDGDASFERLTADLAVDAHEPAERLHRTVIAGDARVRPGATEA